MKSGKKRSQDAAARGIAMQNLLAGIAQNNFVVIGRAGMDFFPDPPGHQDGGGRGLHRRVGRVFGKYRCRPCETWRSFGFGDLCQR